ncbi:hypothetical protein HNQ53_001719 [Microbulbifer hydrolyticus]|uniref:Uncharacterized protein n=1 Tax=Microbulbifer hydrolyticus TaxID=48074 RepID=A0AA89PAZ3_9GAMM|nr:hypothetical protein [Microbulbifer hydrolyticus]
MEDILNDLRATTEILLGAIRGKDDEKAYEAVSVLLFQGFTMLGKDYPTMQKFFFGLECDRGFHF